MPKLYIFFIFVTFLSFYFVLWSSSAGLQAWNSVPADMQQLWSLRSAHLCDPVP